MTYNDICAGTFISRTNRFIADVKINGQTEICHVKNTGRCKELLVPGAVVYLQKSGNPNRSTKYDLVAVEKGARLINMDSQAPNKVFLEYLQSGDYIKDITLIKPETKYGCSRFDFYVESARQKIFIEVKGVTLEENGVVLFPDAPTLRGVKHLNELAMCIRDGYEAHAVFVIQMKGVEYFTTNDRTHREFGEALVSAREGGVRIAALDCDVTTNSLVISKSVPVKLFNKSVSNVARRHVCLLDEPMEAIGCGET
jgi:sugar fermentation stimulation protein A